MDPDPSSREQHLSPTWQLRHLLGRSAVGSPRTSHVRENTLGCQWGVARQAPPRNEVSRSGGLVPCGAGNREGQGPSVIDEVTCGCPRGARAPPNAGA
jgi:hypothetical protein